MNPIFLMAKKYYPRLWNEARLDMLVSAGRLTPSERDRIVREAETDASK